MVALPIQRPLPLIHLPRPRPVRSLPPIRPVRPVLVIQFLPYGKAPQRPNFSESKETDTMIPLPYLNISGSHSRSSVCYHLSLCSSLVPPSSFPACYQEAHPKTISPLPASATRANINFSEKNIHGNPAQSIPRPTRKPRPQLPQPPQPQDEITLLLLIPPHLILHPPQKPLLPDNFPLPLLLHILLPNLSRLDISPSPRPVFFLSRINTHRSIL